MFLLQTQARYEVSHWHYTTGETSLSFPKRHVSDKHVTENSVLLHKVLPGDLVLADHGFDIRDSVRLMCAEVKIPAFAGRCQLCLCLTVCLD